MPPAPAASSPAHGLGAVVVHVHGGDLIVLGVLQGLHLALYGLIADLPIRLAGPVAIGVHSLLASLAVLPQLIPL